MAPGSTDSPLVKLVAAANEVEAERMRRALLAAGIPSVVRNSDPLAVAHMLPPPPFSLWLYVSEADAAEAGALLGIEGSRRRKRVWKRRH